eukprot:312502-Hanusia_phi.AAC.1
MIGHVTAHSVGPGPTESECQDGGRRGGGPAGRRGGLSDSPLTARFYAASHSFGSGVGLSTT